jgi:hypothetical protein
MSDAQLSRSNRFGWLVFPMLVFAASRALLLAFAKSAPLFGPNMGADASRFAQRYPLWASLCHGDIADLARIARAGYVAPADVATFPLGPLLGKLGGVFGAVELALVVISLIACAAAFCGLFRLFELLSGRDGARWGLALVAAFPLAYHLSDGSALALGLAFSTWGVVLALRGSLWAVAVLSYAALAHPLGALSALAAFAVKPLAPAAPRWHRWLLAVVPLALLAGWTLYLVVHLHLTGAALWRAMVPAGPSSHLVSAMLAGFGGLLAIGTVALARRPGLRGLAAVAAVQLLLAALTGTQAAVVSLALCWPAFLGLGQVVAGRPAWRAPLVAMMGAHQGLLLYCFTHFLRQS